MQAQYGEPASVTLAQAILESSDKFGNCGKSQCAIQCKNYFGLKADGTCPYVEFRTTEFIHGEPRVIEAKFQKFDSVEDSFVRHAELIATAPGYRAAMDVCHDKALHPCDRAAAFAQQLRLCGYATDPEYEHKLLDLIIRLDLAKYDAPASTAPTTSTNPPPAAPAASAASPASGAVVQPAPVKEKTT